MKLFATAIIGVATLIAAAGAANAAGDAAANPPGSRRETMGGAQGTWLRTWAVV